MVVAISQRVIEAEIGAGPHGRIQTRTNQRNGSRPRTLTTIAGDLELRIPKLRSGRDPGIAGIRQHRQLRTRAGGRIEHQRWCRASGQMREPHWMLGISPQFGVVGRPLNRSATHAIDLSPSTHHGST